MQHRPLRLEQIGLRDIYRVESRCQWFRKLGDVEAQPEFGYLFRARNLNSKYLRCLNTRGGSGSTRTLDVLLEY